MGQLITMPGQSLAGNPETMLAPSLKVIESRIYRGPHLYSNTPMIRIQVDLGILEDFPTQHLKDFPEKLLEKLPGLASHGCSLGIPGGFVERLKEGTWLGHVIEHVTLELQSLAGMQVTRGKTRSVKGKHGHYNIMYAYTDEDAGLYAGRLAMDLVASLLESPFNQFMELNKVYAIDGETHFDFEERMQELRYLAQKNKLGPTTQSLIDEATRRSIPWLRLDDESLIQLGTGKYQKRVRASITSQTSNIAVEIASNKELTKKLLAEAGIPVPGGAAIRSVEGALDTAEQIGFPVTVKPLDGNHGRGVSTNLHTVEEVAQAFARAKAHSRYVIVEEHYTGQDYRVLVVNGEVAAVAERVPAHVIGNGMDSIMQLIEKINADPRRGEGHEEVMTRIKINEALYAWLAKSNLTLESIPAKDQRVVLAPTANLSTGGTAVDRTDDIHPDNASIARRAALTIGLDVAGIDLILPDITKSYRETGGGIVEVNASPGFRMHLHPAEGQARDVANPVISALFPAEAKTKVPVVTVTGTNGKSTTVRMIAHILRHSGMRVGFTSTSGIYVNDDCIWHGDASGPKSAKKLLQNPTIDIAILETARGGILREGLGVQESDIGAVLNVTEDHIGISGIDSVEDLAAVKSVVVESVHRDGVSILNADDPHTLAMTPYAGGSICYFSMAPAVTSPLREHVEKGGRAVTREFIGGSMQVVLYNDGRRLPIIGVNDIPATSLGAAAFNVENALAATAIATGLGIDPQIIRAALSSFTSSFEQNPGRFNIYDDHGFRVIMDYAHNPAALRAFFNLIREMRTHYFRVIGHTSTPGDRRDEDIREVGRIAGREMDIVVFREAPDRRGRPEGEILRLLAEGARSVGCPNEKIICVATEAEATDICLKLARPGDLIILSPSDVEKGWKQMLDFKPEFVEQHHQKSNDNIHNFEGEQAHA